MNELFKTRSNATSSAVIFSPLIALSVILPAVSPTVLVANWPVLLLRTFTRLEALSVVAAKPATPENAPDIAPLAAPEPKPSWISIFSRFTLLT